MEGEVLLLFSKFIDLYALHNLHKRKSAISLYATPILPIDKLERESFYTSSIVPISIEMNQQQDHYLVGTFQFDSLIKTAFSLNNRIKGEIYLHDKESENTPNIIFVHGWRMNSYDKLKSIFLKETTRLGWNMYFPPLPYHMERTPTESLYNGEFMISANMDRTLEAAQQSVIDLRSMIQWIKLNKPGPVFIVGVSLGGWITNLLATLETQIDGIVSIYYANRLSYSIWNTIPGKFIREDLELHGVSYEELIQHWDITDPSKALPKVKKENILLISGRKDQYISLEDADYLWNSWNRPRRLVYNNGHSGIVLNQKKICRDTLMFIQERVRHMEKEKG